MVVADLHVHTTRSDGSLTLEALPAAAARAGVDAVAVTDHDRIQPALDGPVTEREGVTVVHGIELRVETDTQRLDLLGYGVEATDALRERCAYIQRNRRERGRKIIERVEARLGRPIPVEPREGLGRPHIARAIADVSDHTIQGAFDRLIGDDCPCYVPRELPSFERGRALLAEACGAVGLAHPLRYRDPAAALARCVSLDAVERWYPYDTAVDTGPVETAIDRDDLLPTGGSDAHDDRLGRAGLDGAAWDRLRAAIV
jgi:predicted metal-dependent phosphoesterase TrpH